MDYDTYQKIMSRSQSIAYAIARIEYYLTEKPMDKTAIKLCLQDMKNCNNKIEKLTEESMVGKE